MKTKKKKPQDATLRNIRALKRKVTALESKVIRAMNIALVACGKLREHEMFHHEISGSGLNLFKKGKK